MTTKKIKSNEGIIIEEIYRMIVSYDMAEKDDALDCAKEFATNLLKKLNKLNRKQLEHILDTSSYWYSTKPTGTECMGVSKDMFIDQILQLVPEEGEVIAEGKVRIPTINYMKKIYIGDNFIGEARPEYRELIALKLKKYKNKQVQIIIKQIDD